MVKKKRSNFKWDVWIYNHPYKFTALMIIFSIIISLAIIILIYNLIKLEFVINKTECWNEIDYKNKSCELGKVADCKYKYKYEKDSVILYDDDKDPMWCIITEEEFCEFGTKEVCKPMLVDEIETKKEVNECIKDIDVVLKKCGGDIGCIKDYNYGYDCSYECGEITEDNNCKDYKNYKVLKISKQDLTIEWLDENCEVYWCDLSNEEKEKYSYFNEKFGNCDYFTSIYNEGWNKWKCGEYFVKLN